jgi:metallo-beta-lactamase family protein
MDTSVSVQFLGGVADGENLTGSCIMLQIEAGKRKHRFLIDAGLVQCRFRESLERNLDLIKRLRADLVDGVILTHGHIDHSGRLPLLVKNGFTGRIYCTEQTARLLPIMLEDNARIQLHEAAYRKKKARQVAKNEIPAERRWLGNYDRLRKKSQSRGCFNPLTEPLYTLDHVKSTCALVKVGGFEYEEWIRLAKGVDLKFYPSGHVLGGAICVVRIETKDGLKHLGFSGDLGRADGIILPPPKIVNEPIDHWFSESTYGGRTHPERDEEIERLLAVVKNAAANGGKIIIPSFALERTQEVIYLLSKHMADGDIPKIPIFLDSPMASKITSVFSQSWHSPGLFKGQNELSFNPFCSEQNRLLRLVTGQDESSKLIEAEGAHIVIAGSGMCDAGRVRGHLRKNLPEKETTVCLVGYMTEGSLGRKLKEHWPLVRMNGEEIAVNANIVVFESFSAHADSPFLNAYAQEVAAKNESGLKNVFIIHGERKSALDLKVELMKTLSMEGKNIIMPKIGDVFVL